MASDKSQSARQKAAEARAAAEAADKRRRMIINVSIGAVLLLVVAALVGGAWLTKQSNQEVTQPSADAALPAGAFAAGTPYQYGIEWTTNAQNKPTLELWEDFQCPACRDFEAAYGPTVAEIVKNNDAQVIFRSTSFLDQRYPGANSQRAAAAYGCAVDAGAGEKYHTVIYANQPANEGDGYTDQQLLDFATQAGITGEAKATFDQCVKDKKYMQWAANGTQAMQEAGIPGTPGVILNGQQMTKEQLASPEAFKQAIQDAAANKQ
ncbi:MAG: thioredoxin domain-containing protein [Candidatus Nanopelagicales bacterium]